MNWTQLMCAERPRAGRNGRNGTDLRTEFEKDYHRIISSAAFRRLQDKTQVFPLDQSDFIRTRLTHSLEVSSFAKSLGQNIGSRILAEGKDAAFTLRTQMDLCDVLQCAGLLHDIGNPPFGHFGEEAIQDWFRANLKTLCYAGTPLCEILNEQMVQDFMHFEGNSQTLRVVSRLHFLVDEKGMNLTKALLATLIKYPGSSLEIGYQSEDPNRDIRRKKMGYFYADRKLFDEIESATGTNGRRHPLSFLLEAADDIAYTTADYEDMVKKGLIDYPTLLNELREKCLVKGADQRVKNLLARIEALYRRAQESGYENPYLYAVQNWVVNVQGAFLTAATDSFLKHYDEIMDGTYRFELLENIPSEILLRAMQDISYRYAFVSKPILKLEVKADCIFGFLLDKFVHSFLYYDTKYWNEKKTVVDEKVVMLMSENYMRVYHDNARGKSEAERLYLRLLLVTDYISGMTDGYAMRMYEEMH